MSIKEESHTLREWQKILANNPELMAEFEELTPPTPIKGDISEQPVSDHHEIEVEFRGEKVTISREFYRDGEINYSTSEQDDNAIWAALRAWCEKKGITPFGLYPKQPEQPMEGLEEEIKRYLHEEHDRDTTVRDVARHFAEWQKGNIKNLLKSWAENELDEHPNKNDDFRLAIYSLIDKLNDL